MRGLQYIASRQFLSLPKNMTYFDMKKISIIPITSLFVVLLGSQLLSDESIEGKSLSEKLFQQDHLLKVEIKVSDSDWEKLSTETRRMIDAFKKTPPERPYNYYPAQVTIDGVTFEKVMIRKKGLVGSLSETRPSLKVKFEAEERNSKGLPVSRLTLNNNVQDPSISSQFLFYDLFKRVGLPAPRCNLAKVTVNGKSLGIYSNVESIKKAFIERSFSDSSGVMYEGTVADLFPGRLQRFEIKRDPKGRGLAPLEELTQVLHAKEPSLQKISEHVDLDAFRKFWVLESMGSCWDGYSSNQNNYFMYHNPKNSKLYWIPWGADAVFQKAPPLPFLPNPPVSIHPFSKLAHTLYQLEAERELVKKTIKEFFETVWSEKVFTEKIELIESLAQDHVHPDQKKFSESQKNVLKFIKNRKSKVLAEMEEWPLDVSESLRVPVYSKLVGKIEGTFETNWSNKNVVNPMNEGKATLHLEYEGEKIELKKMGVSAEPYNQGFGQVKGDVNKVPPGLAFMGIRKSNNQWITIKLIFKMKEFKPSSKDAGNEDSGSVVEGFFIEGFNFFNFEAYRSVQGKVTLKEAKREDGAPVAGKIHVEIFQWTTD